MGNINTKVKLLNIKYFCFDPLEYKNVYTNMYTIAD